MLCYLAINTFLAGLSKLTKLLFFKTFIRNEPSDFDPKKPSIL